MSKKNTKIEKLLEEFCPQGVEFRALEELGSFYGGLTGKSKNDFSEGNSKFVTYMNIFSNISVNIDIDNLVKISNEEKQRKINYGDVLFTGSSETPNECGMSSVLIKKVDEPLYLNSFCFGFRFHDTDLFLPDFSKYLFRDALIRKQISKTASGVTRFNISKKRFAKIKIPIPPLTIQKEIVKILDNFTQLEAELEAELEARKKQYEHYREQLLMVNDKGLMVDGTKAEFRELGEVCDIGAGGDLPKNYIKGQDKPSKEFQYPIYSNGSDEKALYGYTDNYKINDEAVTVSARGTIGYHSVRSAKFTPIVRLITLIPSIKIITVKFLNYVLDITEIGHSGGSIPQLTVPNVKKIIIPIPPLAKQKEIVAILDKFDALVNDISIGLPAEITARKKQYEYYRNQLLSFKPLEAQDAS